MVDELLVIAEWALQRTGLFHSAPRSDIRLGTHMGVMGKGDLEKCG